MAPQVWLITGCSSGFGQQFVHSVLARGDKVIATGRKAAERLKHLEDSGAAIVDLDVSLPEAEIKQIIDKAAAIYGTIDVLVNNAGSSSFATFEEVPTADYEKLFQANYFGVLSVTRAVIPYMRAKQSGTISIVGSMYGCWSPPCTTAYAGSKFALESLGDGLRIELAPFNIRTIVFEPGYFATDLSKPERLLTATPSNTLDEYSAIHQLMMATAEKVVGNHRGDVKKGVEIMVDVIRGEGCAQGRKFPTRLPIGPDAVSSIETKCKAMLKLIETWRADITNTDRDDYVPQEGLEILEVPPPMES